MEDEVIATKLISFDGSARPDISNVNKRGDALHKCKRHLEQASEGYKPKDWLTLWLTITLAGATGKDDGFLPELPAKTKEVVESINTFDLCYHVI